LPDDFDPITHKIKEMEEKMNYIHSRKSHVNKYLQQMNDKIDELLAECED
jgi:prefoldin subunit 5